MRKVPDIRGDGPVVHPDDGRLESWKEIATYLGKDVKTVQRWEKRTDLPVHRYSDPTILSVYAFRSELDAWRVQAHPTNGNGEAANGAATGPWTNLRVAAAVFGAVALTAMFVWIVSSNQTEDAQLADRVPPFEQDDYVLITQFENLTDNPLFDEGTLEYALELALSDSRYLHVAQPERVEDALRLMKRPLDTVVDRSVGREVALRDGGIRVVLAGAIEKSDTGYALTTLLVNPEDGRVLDSVRDEAADEAGVTSAIHRQASQVRERLGEALSLIQASQQRLEKVTTPSLRALQLYNRGYWIYRRTYTNVDTSRFNTVEELLRLAIKEDPSFAAAHHLLADSIRGTGRPREEYFPHMERALELAEDATEQDRLFIEGSYFSWTEQLEKAAAKYEALLDLQPEHYYAMASLVNANRRLGRPQPRVELFMRAADARPNDVRLQTRCISALLRLRQLDRTEPYVERIKRLTTQETLPMVVTFLPAYAHWLRGEIEEALREVEKVTSTIPSRTDGPREKLALTTPSRYLQLGGMFYLALGQLDKAEELFNAMPSFRRVPGN